jgi:hypothetical protein
MKKKCPNCELVNFSEASECLRCSSRLTEVVSEPVRSSRIRNFLVRAAICIFVCFIAIAGFYLSLIMSSHGLNIEQKSELRRASSLLKERGFQNQAFLLDSVTVFRGSDNWLNASVAKENAYAATNYPFEIITLYSDFFTYPKDDIERAAILLHEAEHLKGKNEHDAYDFVWRHRAQIGWTRDRYASSPVWQNIRKQTRDNVPELFNCPDREVGDCTE